MEMLKLVFDFRTQYDRQRIFTVPGDSTRILYELRYDDDGSEYLEEVGKEDIYEQIQSHMLSVDINYLLSRYAQGDPDILERRQAVYGDFSQMPKTYAEMLNRLVSAENAFDQLPIDIKNQFNNSMSEWLAQYGSNAWIQKMGYKLDGVASAPVADQVAIKEVVGE